MADTPSPSTRDKAKAGFANWMTQARTNPLFIVTLIGALVVMLADQASKVWIVEVLRLPDRRQIDLSPIIDLTYVKNYGASFGMLAGGLGSRIFLSLLSSAIVVFLVTWLAQVRRPLLATGIAFLIGGAVGNLVDRVLYGYVIDFIDASGLMFPWVFNVADAAINVGIAFLVLDYFTNRDEVTP